MAVARPRLIDTLNHAASTLCEALDADACAISRVLGDVLLFVTEHAPPGRTLLNGQSYLVSEYPETKRTVETGEPRVACLADPETDPAEARVLRDLGFAAVLLLPLELQGERWGLVEVFRETPRPFGAMEMRAAAIVLADLG